MRSLSAFRRRAACLIGFCSAPGAAALLLTPLLLTGSGARAQAWQSLITSYQLSNDVNVEEQARVVATAADASGDIYLTGFFAGIVSFGPFTLNSIRLNVSSDDIFIAKYRPSTNTFLWAVRAGGRSVDQGTAIAVSGGSVYVTGSFYFSGDTGVLGPDFGPFQMTPVGNNDVFIAKLSAADGTFTWVRQAGGPGLDAGTGLSVSGATIHLAGTYRTNQTFTFGGTTFPAVPGQAASTRGFVGKMTDTGTAADFNWVLPLTGPVGDVAPTALAVSGSSIYLAGSYQAQLTLAGLPPVGGPVGGEMFVTKLTDAGATASFVWVQGGGGAGRDGATALAVRGSSVYVAGDLGQFSTKPTFGTITLTAQDNDLFVAKLIDAGSTGSFGWARAAGGSDEETATALVVSGSSVYLSGTYRSTTISFGNLPLTNTRRSYNAYVTRLTDAGASASFDWVQQAGRPAADGGPDNSSFNNYVRGFSLLLSGGRLWLAGACTAPTEFGPIKLALSATPPVVRINTPLAFLASLTDATPTATAGAARAAGYCLYPNPTRSTATLRRPAGAASTALHLTDALGRTVRRYPAPAAGALETALDLRGLPAGLYGLRGAAFSLRLQVE